MRVFLCFFTGFSVAIPMDCVASLILHKKAAKQTIEYDSENNNTFISLPLLFQSPQAVIRHGIILKTGNNNESEDTSGGLKNKIILLTTEVECEAEIPSEKIYPVPGVLGVFNFSAFFNGISFNLQEEKTVSRRRTYSETLNTGSYAVNTESSPFNPPFTNSPLADNSQNEGRYTVLFLNPEKILDNAGRVK